MFTYNEYIKYFSPSVTVREIVWMEDADLLKLPGFGKRHLDHIHALRQEVAKQGISGHWYMDPDHHAIPYMAATARK